MNRIKYRAAAAALLVTVLISCSQKYDDTGIFDPSDPNFSADTLSAVSDLHRILLPEDRISDGFMYIGADITSPGDTSAWAQPLIKFTLPPTYGLDSSYIRYRLYEYPDTLDIGQYFSGRRIEVYRTPSGWNADSISYPPPDLVLIDTVTVEPDTSGQSYDLRIDLNTAEIENWAAQDSTRTASFFLRCADDENISPVIKFYSAGWEYTSVRPTLNSFYSFADSVTAFDGGDSTIFTSVTDYVDEDMTFAFKKPYSSAADSVFVLGGISGESFLCRIPLDSIPSDAVVLTGRISLTATGVTDSLYGGIENSLSTSREIRIYLMTDSLWYSDPGVLNYDEPNVWTYKINLGGNDNYLTMDTPVQNWINDPGSNFGFLITSQNWGSPFGLTEFLVPEFNISYIRAEK